LASLGVAAASSAFGFSGIKHLLTLVGNTCHEVKPELFSALSGTAKAVPFPKPIL